MAARCHHVAAHRKNRPERGPFWRSGHSRTSNNADNRISAFGEMPNGDRLCCAISQTIPSPVSLVTVVGTENDDAISLTFGADHRVPVRRVR